MARRHPLIFGERRSSGEEMVLSPDSRSFRRGRRIAPRTEVCRPCLLWQAEHPEERKPAVALDLNAHGMRVRSLEAIPMGAEVLVQLMRDEDFRIPLSYPLRLRVVRLSQAVGGFYDLGMRLLRPRIPRANEVRPAARVARRASFGAGRATLDIKLGDYRVGNLGKRRG